MCPCVYVSPSVCLHVFVRNRPTAEGFIAPTYAYITTINTVPIQVVADYCYLASSLLYTWVAWCYFDPRDSDRPYADVESSEAVDDDGLPLTRAKREDDGLLAGVCACVCMCLCVPVGVCVCTCGCVCVCVCRLPQIGPIRCGVGCE